MEITAKDIQTVVKSADGQVLDGACWLIGVNATDDGNGTFDLTIYDGHGTGDRKMLHIRGLQHTSPHLKPVIPMRFEKGIYLDIGTNCGVVTFQISSKAD